MKKLVLIVIVGGLMRAQSDAPAFEVASVKQDTRYSWVRRPWSPNVDCGPIAKCGVSGNRFTDEFASLDDLLMDAFSVKRFQIVNLPRWGDTGKDVYDVEARAAEGQALTLAEARWMLQTLLAERFQLKVHHEMRELPVYALVRGKGALKLKPADKPCAYPPGPDGRTLNLVPPAGRTFDLMQTWDTMAEMLSGRLDRPVVDKTGLDAEVYCTLDGLDPKLVLQMAMGPGGGARRGGDPQNRTTIPEADSTAPSVSVAVEEKWGLKLEPQKASADVLVIDRVERPSEN